MTLSAVREYLDSFGLGDRIRIVAESSATVELAAAALGCEPKQIVKTLTFLVSGEPIMILCPGHVKIDNAKFKARFGEKARMIPAGEVGAFVGHEAGGVCPFAVKDGVKIFFDESLRENDRMYPAAGDDHSGVELNLSELTACARPDGWVDVCRKV